MIRSCYRVAQFLGVVSARSAVADGRYSGGEHALRCLHALEQRPARP